MDDVTERHKTEETLRRSQKMDAIGKLTGGIAHDFNNMLGIMLGFSELLRANINEKDLKLVQYCDQILKAGGQQARMLTSKLLEFSRKAPSAQDITHINQLVNDMKHMLEKTLTARIVLNFELETELWPVCLDSARLEDAILNLSINAMHAMPDGGTLTINTRNMHLTEADLRNLELTPGDYVFLTISDTGTGIPHEIQQQIFDPFFTTKDDEGTDLGLSQVYGFVQQMGGQIQVYSEPGQGSSFVLCFPKSDKIEMPELKNIDKTSQQVLAGQETVLIVDDEPGLLILTEDILTLNGYKTICAESAEQALEILKSEHVDLLLSDVIMPGMDGYQLASLVQDRYPMIKIQMVSGYSEKQHESNVSGDTLHTMRIEKPYSAENLLMRVRELLDNHSDVA